MGRGDVDVGEDEWEGEEGAEGAAVEVAVEVGEEGSRMWNDRSSSVRVCWSVWSV